MFHTKKPLYFTGRSHCILQGEAIVFPIEKPLYFTGRSHCISHRETTLFYREKPLYFTGKYCDSASDSEVTSAKAQGNCIDYKYNTSIWL